VQTIKHKSISKRLPGTKQNDMEALCHVAMKQNSSTTQTPMRRSLDKLQISGERTPVQNMNGRYNADIDLNTDLVQIRKEEINMNNSDGGDVGDRFQKV
jgi:hypothetical protein